MTPINAYNPYGRPVGDHRRSNLQSDALMNVGLHDGGCKTRPRPTTGRYVMLVQKRAIDWQAKAEMLEGLNWS